MPQAPSPASPPTARDNGATLYSTDKSLFDPNSVRYDYSDDLAAGELNWNKAFPYQLAVLEVNPGIDLTTGQGGFITYGIHNGLIFTLPINPESLMNSMPFAIAVSATLGGVVEQHGGAPFRGISFQGTFGVVSDRPSATETQGGTLGQIGGIFGGTIQAAAGVTSSAASLGIGERYSANISDEVPGDGEGDIPSQSTGFYQFRALQRFLEAYAEAKKTSSGQNLRLALFIWKENAAYLVTPQAFDVSRTAQSPFEYRYSLRLQAWRRVDPNSITVAPGGTVYPEVNAASSFTLSKAYTFISNSIHTVRAVINTLKAVRKDIANIVGVFRQVALFVASIGALVKTALTLPAGIRKDFQSAIREDWDIIAGSFDGLDPHVKSKVDKVTEEVAAFRSGVATETPTLQALLLDDNEGDFHDLIKPDSLNLTSPVRAALDDYINTTLTLTSDDFRKYANTVFSVIDDYADVVGLNDPTYDKVTGRTPKAKVRDATYDDFRAMHSLALSAISIQSLVVNTPDRQAITTIEYIAGLANANGIAMRVPKSKFAVPFPYGSSLERLAQQYLNDPSRWLEIAELNDLRAPYVDEDGTVQALITNGMGSIINMTDASDLRIGQFVTLWSDTVIPDKRRIVSIHPLGPVQWQVVLDGADDLSKLKVVNHASIQWFTVGTVNSQQVIYIPSDDPANLDILRYVPSEQDFNRILTTGEVDGMLSDTGDLVITPDGDWPIVLGLAALIQWARVALNTPVRSLSMHPTFGLDAQIGQSLAESTATDILKSVRTTFRFNPTFTGVLAALVQRNGPTSQVSLELGVRGVDALLPLTFDVKS